MDDLPARWTKATLENCVDILDSLRVPVNSSERERRKGAIPYYGATGRVGWIDDFLFDEELLLIGEDGAPFFDKSKPISYVIKGKSWVNNHAHVMKAVHGITTNAFLKYYLNQFDFTGYVNGTTRLKLTQGSLRAIPVKIPPSTEQHRIVAKLEKLLAKVDACKERLEKIPAILKRFRQSVLAAACSGRLTSEWRSKNADFEAAISDQSNKSVVPENSSPLPILPSGWSRFHLQDLCEVSRSLTYGVIKLGPSQNNGIPTLRSSDVRWLNVDVSNVKRIAQNVANNYGRTFLNGGEVLVTVRGSLGGVAAVPEALKGFNISREVAMVPVKSHIISKYVSFAIASNWSQTWLAEVSKGVAYTGINIRDLKRLPIPLPGISEQQEIVRRVEALFKMGDDIAKRYEKANAHVDKLTQSILAKAFRGELVPQDPNDEPASELLKRIHAEREKMATEGNKAGRKKSKGREIRAGRTA